MRPATSRADPAPRSRLAARGCARRSALAPRRRPGRLRLPARRRRLRRHRHRRRRRLDPTPGRHPPLRADHRRSTSTKAGDLTDGDLRDLTHRPPAGADRKPDRGRRAAPPASSHTPRNSPFQASLSGESCPDAHPGRHVTVQSLLRRRRDPHLRPLQPGAAARASRRCSAASPYGMPITFAPQDPRSRRRIRPHPRAREPLPAAQRPGFRADDLGQPLGVAHNAQRGNCLNETEPGTFGNAPNCPRLRTRHLLAAPKASPQAYLTLPTSCAAPLAFTVSADLLAAAGPGHATSPPRRSGDPLTSKAATRSPSTRVRRRRAVSPTAPPRRPGFDFDPRRQHDRGRLLDPADAGPLAGQEGGGHAARGDDDQPLRRPPASASAPRPSTRPRRSLAARRRLPERLQDRRADRRKARCSKARSKARCSSPTPRENPFGSLLALYLVAKAPERGVMVKVAGKVDADPGDGRLTATFDDLPQLPYSHFNVHFREGQRSPLATPAACGDYATEIDLSPWLDPDPVFRADVALHAHPRHRRRPLPGRASRPSAPGANVGHRSTATPAATRPSTCT